MLTFKQYLLENKLPMSEYDQESGSVHHLVSSAEKKKKSTEARLIDIHKLAAKGKLHKTQSWLNHGNGGGGEDAVVHGHEDHPVLVKTKDGVHHIVDGHHRIDNALKHGKHIKAHIYAID